MDDPTILSHLMTAMVLYFSAALPPLIAALVLGLIIGLFQATTQIQDQTMPQTFKLMAVIGVLVLLSPVLITPMLTYAQRVFDEFPALTR